MSNTTLQETSRRKPRRALSVLGTVLCSLLVLAAFICFYAAVWFVTVYGQIGFDAVLFTLQSSLSGVQSDLIGSYLEGGLKPALMMSTAVNFILFFHPKKGLSIPVGKDRVQVYPFHRVVSIVLAVVMSVCLLAKAAVKVEMDQYIQNMFNRSSLFEDQYVDPDDVQITFPEEKRNLVYIMLESMETRLPWRTPISPTTMVWAASTRPTALAGPSAPLWLRPPVFP